MYLQNDLIILLNKTWEMFNEVSDKHSIENKFQRFEMCNIPA